jgi:haloalkane dehalogenase
VLERIEAGLAPLAHLPIQLIWGLRDWCFRPQCLQRFVQHWPHAEVHRFADCGHYIVEDAHERIVPLVRSFIGKLSTSVTS